LVEGVVGRAHERASLDVLEAHGFSENFVLGEFIGVDVADDGQVLAGGLEILA
jgi:hypothetical protein